MLFYFGKTKTTAAAATQILAYIQKCRKELSLYSLDDDSRKCTTTAMVVYSFHNYIHRNRENESTSLGLRIFGLLATFIGTTLMRTKANISYVYYPGELEFLLLPIIKRESLIEHTRRRSRSFGYAGYDIPIWRDH